ncbi:hypothetical protein IWW38_002759 [Coemansia aciculifera]|uniref:Uncharacterized protein n=1 Tax=Coemansia aciculifera TaxID=417176 RepID=A0ACC1M456_9FUNG|nr:hypothetical protein IWW38_002759 [Coemansia aciculifera]
MIKLSISGLEATSYDVNTKNIAAALTPFGEIKDIIFTRWGLVTDSCAEVILDLEVDEKLPDQLQIGNVMANITSTVVKDAD